jgi:hypothetical protein
MRSSQFGIWGLEFGGLWEGFRGAFDVDAQRYCCLFAALFPVSLEFAARADEITGIKCTGYLLHAREHTHRTQVFRKKNEMHSYQANKKEDKDEIILETSHSKRVKRSFFR